ncbi:ABC-three component system protein [Morganella morganii]|uniref:ABC-three component system protein n=1 Tax=Morganella morganii TaxID=582 RepID=UPI002FDAA525
MEILNKLKKVFICGDYVGRDKYVYNTNPTQLMLLQEEYQEEFKNKQTCTVIIDELNHYNTRKSKIRDLEDKLRVAGYSSLLDDARELKELVSKLIVQYQYYRSAQKIIVFLLSDIHSIFQYKIKPCVVKKEHETKILELIYLYIECALSEKLGINALEIYNRHLRGMVFFLTGNCHLEWE